VDLWVKSGILLCHELRIQDPQLSEIQREHCINFLLNTNFHKKNIFTLQHLTTSENIIYLVLWELLLIIFDSSDERMFNDFLTWPESKNASIYKREPHACLRNLVCLCLILYLDCVILSEQLNRKAGSLLLTYRQLLSLSMKLSDVWPLNFPWLY